MTAQVEQALKQIHATMAKLAEQVEALEASVNQEATPGQQAKAALAHFARTWTTVYRTKYQPNYPKEIPICKRILTGLTLEDVTARMDRYLRTQDAFYTKARHSIGIFAVNVNQFGNGEFHASAEPADRLPFSTGPAMDCHHRPECRSDHEHTMRMSSERRA